MIDLHTHSCRSDGTDTPAQLLEKALACGLRAIALTDHDTVDGLAEFQAAGAGREIEAVPGIEISVDARLPENGHLHMLGLYIDPASPALSPLKHFQEVRRQRAAQIVERLQKLGVAMSLDELYREAGEGSIGRPHVARLLIRQGVVKTMQEAFDNYLSPGKPAFVEKAKLSSADAIRMIQAAGGLAILAHPQYLGYDNPTELIERIAELVEEGLDGLEVYYPGMPVEMKSALLEFAGRRQLLVTGGSDYHGSVKPDTRLGSGIDGRLNVPDDLLLRLQEAHAKRVLA